MLIILGSESWVYTKIRLYYVVKKKFANSNNKLCKASE